MWLVRHDGRCESRENASNIPDTFNTQARRSSWHLLIT